MGISFWVLEATWNGSLASHRKNGSVYSRQRDTGATLGPPEQESMFTEASHIKELLYFIQCAYEGGAQKQLGWKMD